MSDPFIGQIMVLPYTFAPVNWLDCYGQTLPVSQYAALYSLLGTSFGGSINVNFKLPDLRGRVVIGEGSGPGLTPRRLGEASGTENVTMTTNQLPAHSHTITATVGQTPGFSASVQALSTNGTASLPSTAQNQKCYLAGGVTTDGTETAVNIYYPTTSNPPGTSVNLSGVTVSLQNVATTGAGLSQPTPIMQPYLAIKYVIATAGIYPERP